jgi:hypothetical protein
MAIKTDKSTTDDDLDFLEGGQDGTNPEMPDFTSGGSIFSIPAGGLLGSVNIGADGATPNSLLTGTPAGGFLSNAGVTFDVPGFGLGSLDNIFGSTPSTFLGTGLNLGAGSDFGGGNIVTLPKFVVTENRIGGTPPVVIGADGGQGGGILGGGVGAGEGGGIVTMTPFYVTDTVVKTPSVSIATSDLTKETTETKETPEEIITMTPFVVTDTRVQTPATPVVTAATVKPTISPITTEPVVTMTPFVVTDTKIGPSPSISIATSAVTFTTGAIFTTPVITAVPPTTQLPPPTFMPTTFETPQATPGGVGAGTGTGTSYGTMRDFEAELGKSLAALQKYQPQMLGMYKDIYNQFMPESLTAASRSALGQLQADEAKLARLRAGQLSPEDVRQSQQAAREAYGARGQAMGTGAIGAEILNRENIRQQREDQARAAYQQSMGNLFNTANLQTGNIFNPIASLISGSFNPLGAYPADVYGTNVNAQLARDIAQKNYEAAIKSAELSGAAQKQAGTTSAIGSILGAPGVAKGVIGLFGIPLPSCMPGDQCIDTPSGPVEIQNIKGGDIVIGYDGQPAYVAQVSSWSQDPFRAFFTFTFEDGSKFTVCDDHKILNIPAMEWAEGAEMGGRKIVKIETSTGHTTSYDLMTNQGGYQINGVPVNSMIPEIILAAANHVASVNQKVAEITK